MQHQKKNHYKSEPQRMLRIPFFSFLHGNQPGCLIFIAPACDFLSSLSAKCQILIGLISLEKILKLWHQTLNVYTCG